MIRKHLLTPSLISAALSLGLLSCGSDTETVQEPTRGVVTTMTEVSPGDFRIIDEKEVPNVSDSRIILNKMDSTTQVISLAEARAMTGPDSLNYPREERSAVRRSGGGFFYFMMFNRMGGFSRQPGAYANSQAYQRSGNSGIGSSLKNTSRTTTRTRSGFGGRNSSGGSRTGGSSRSFGG